MSSELTSLHELTLLRSPILVNLPNGTQVKVTHKGKLRIGKGIVLNNVLLVPNFKFNLLSIKRLCEQLGCTVEFMERLCMLQAPSLRRPLAIGKDFIGLYILDRDNIQDVELLRSKRQLMAAYSKTENTCDKSVTVFNNVAQIADFYTWHQRLGHMSCNKMRNLFDDSLSYHSVKHFVCEICPKAKQHRLPFPTSKSTSGKAFELIHVDTWGPYHTKTHVGHR